MLAVAVGLLVLLPGPAGPVAEWVWPVAGSQTVLRPFAPPQTRYGPGHRGADVAAAVGSPVRAAGAGRVSYAGLLAGRGVVVVVHGDLRSTYEPVRSSVRVGDAVRAGDVLGRLAAGGHCPVSCLHWGLRRGDVYLDPVRLVRGGPSRLLPVEGPPAAPAARSARTAPLTPVAPVPSDEPALSLRGAQAPWAAGAVVALVAGLALVRRPGPRPPRRPPVAPAVMVATPRDAGTPEPIDLGAERSRRRVV